MITSIKNFLMDYIFYIVIAAIIILWMLLHFLGKRKKSTRPSVKDIRNIPFIKQKMIAEHELDRLISLNFQLVKSEDELEKAYIDRKEIIKKRRNDLKERYNEWFDYYNSLKKFH